MSFGSPTGDLTNLATTDKSSLVGAVNEVKNTLVAAAPAGAIVGYGGDVIPTNWLLCDGSVVSRTTYASLFSAIGTTYGVGDGSTTFGLPDLKGRVPVGRDSGQTEFDTMGETGGAKTHTLSTTEMPSHKHNVQRSGQYQTWVADGADGAAGGNRWHTADGVANVDTDYQGGGAAHNNLQPYQVIRYIIKFTNGDSPTDSQLTQRVSVAEAGTNLVAMTREKVKRSQAALHGGGIRAVGRNADVAWNKPFYTMGAGRDTLSPHGYFNISMPADGTIIPVLGHATVTSITVGATVAGRISLTTVSAWSALYYILPISSGAASVPGNFRVVDYTNGTTTIPDNWILIVQRNFDQATTEFKWGDGLRQAPWYGVTFTNSWRNFDAAWDDAGWKRAHDGELIMRGLVAAGTGAGLICTADASRPGPEKRQIFICHANAGTARVDVLVDGSVWLDGYFAGGNNAYVSLAQVRWYPAGA